MLNSLKFLPCFVCCICQAQFPPASTNSFTNGPVCNDPLYAFNGGSNRVAFSGGQGFTASTYGWHLANTGEQPRIYQNGVLQPQYDEPSGSGSAHVAEAWGIQSQASNVTVAIIDSGFDLGHEDLAGRFLPGVAIDYGVESTNILAGSHGTHMAGLIGAIGNNAMGVAGVCRDGVKLLPVQVSRNSNDRTLAIQWANAHGADIILLTEGLDASAFAVVSNSRALIVCAVPNGIGSLDAAPDYPASWALPNVLSVAAVRMDHALYSGWTSVNALDVMAPGRRIPTTSIGNAYVYDSGTSVAAAVAAGCAALVKARFPTLTAAQLKQVLCATVDVRAQYAVLCRTGGSLNVARAVGSAQVALAIQRTRDFQTWETVGVVAFPIPEPTPVFYRLKPQ